MSDKTDLDLVHDKKAEAVYEIQKAIKLQSDEMKRLGTASAETVETIEKANKAITDLNAEKAVLEERLGVLETAFKRGRTGTDGQADNQAVEAYKAVMDNLLRRGDMNSHSSPEYQKALADVIGDNASQKAMAVNSQADGGLWVHPDMSGRIADVIRDTSVVRALAAVQNITTDSLSGPVDEGRLPYKWVAEQGDRGETGTPQIGQWNITTHELMAFPAVTTKLLQDSAFDPVAFLQTKGAETFALAEEEAFVKGNGVFQPRGFATYAKEYSANVGVVARGKVRTVRTGAAGDLTDPNVMVKTVYALKQQYRRNATWGGSRAWQEKVRLMIQDGKFTWQPGLQAGQPDRLLGYAIGEMNDLGNLQANGNFADGDVIGAFGDFRRAYQVVDRLGMSVLRDPYTKPGWEVLRMTKRVGGDMISFDAMVYQEASAA